MRQPKSSTEHTLCRLQIYTFRRFPANFPPSFFAILQVIRQQTNSSHKPTRLCQYKPEAARRWCQQEG